MSKEFLNISPQHLCKPHTQLPKTTCVQRQSFIIYISDILEWKLEKMDVN